MTPIENSRGVGGPGLAAPLCLQTAELAYSAIPTLQPVLANIWVDWTGCNTGVKIDNGDLIQCW